MAKIHSYDLQLTWTGNRGAGTYEYTAYDRKFTLSAINKPDILGSADPAFRGNKDRYNPEELMISSIASCHMLWYLHLAAANNLVIMDYKDNPSGTIEVKEFGLGRFIEVTLRPTVIIHNEDQSDLAVKLHDESHNKCIIADSFKFDIHIEPKIIIEK